MAHKTIIPISLDVEADKDIIGWLQRQPKRARSASVRAAIRQHISGSVNLADVYEIVSRIERKIARGMIVTGGAAASEADDYHEPPDITATLDALGT